MAVTKVLARSWTKQILTAVGPPEVWTDIKGINSFSVASSVHNADTTDFESGGFTEFIPAARGYTVTLEGFYMVSDDVVNATYSTSLGGTNDDLTYTARVGGAPGNNCTLTYVVAGLSTPLSVSVAGPATTVNVATNGAGAAISTARQVMQAVNLFGAPITAALKTGNDGTGVVAALAVQSLTGGTNSTARDPGQAAVEAIDQVVGTAGIGEFRLITPGGTIWEFYGTVDVSGPGGDHQNAATWRCTITVKGQITIT